MVPEAARSLAIVRAYRKDRKNFSVLLFKTTKSKILTYEYSHHHSPPLDARLDHHPVETHRLHRLTSIRQPMVRPSHRLQNVQKTRHAPSFLVPQHRWQLACARLFYLRKKRLRRHPFKPLPHVHRRLQPLPRLHPQKNSQWQQQLTRLPMGSSVKISCLQ